MTIKKGKNAGQWFLTAKRCGKNSKCPSVVEVWDERGQFAIGVKVEFGRTVFFWLKKEDWKKVWKEMV